MKIDIVRTARPVALIAILSPTTDFGLIMNDGIARTGNRVN